MKMAARIPKPLPKLLVIMNVNKSMKKINIQTIATVIINLIIGRALQIAKATVKP